jgi:D-alanyl-D-alanine carboxypeptidase (penicillin-binding protein 5/6)
MVLVLSLMGVVFAAWPASAAAIPELSAYTITPAFAAGATTPPNFVATAAILVDATTGKVLYEKNADQRLPMASTTKIMTAILVLETLDLDQKVVVPKDATGIPGSIAGLMWGEVLTVEQLMYALLIPSGNDAALTLAEKSAGSVQAFVNKMNGKAEEMGLTNTHFGNPNGLHLENHYSSARDLATMAEYAMQNPVFRRIVDTPEYELPYPGEDQGIREWKSGNVLLNELPWVNGIKTGSTPYAGYCMVVSASRDGVSLIGVLLNDPDDDTRWVETKALLDYGMGLFPPTVLVDKGELVEDLDISDPIGRTVRLVSSKAVTMRLAPDEVVTAQPRLFDDVRLPVHVGDELGVLDFTIDGVFVDSVKLIAANSVPIPDLDEILEYWHRPLDAVSSIPR